jgi:hypothetical protein
MQRLKQKFSDLQAVVTVMAVLLMMPPVILIFDGAGLVNEIPVVVAFIFGAWLLLILATWLLTRLHQEPTGQPDSTPPTEMAD